LAEQSRTKDRLSNDHGSLGTRLRERRLELGFTLKAVADQAGLSVGFISQIERGITIPSLSSLVSVSRVLGVNVGDFLTTKAQGSDGFQSGQSGRPVFAVSESSVSYERISSAFPGHVMRSVIIHEPPGHRSEPIAHEGEEMMFVLEGSITIEVARKRTILGVGDSVHFPSTKVHSSWNHTDKPAKILWTGTMDVFCEEPSEAFQKNNKKDVS
tara:strand:- start:21853 stop:22491 length:639 start_codon:yes stop_codon:yes gene_type:complete